jgi:hypothetical protein
LAAINLNNAGIKLCKEPSKELNVDGGRHEHEFQIFPLEQQALQDSEHEISMQMSLVDFVQNYDVVSGKLWVSLNLLLLKKVTTSIAHY